MAYNQKKLDCYRQLLAENQPFRSSTCPYCTGARDATVKHTHPSTKPASPWVFWRDVLLRKYEAVQSSAAQRNLESSKQIPASSITSTEEREAAPTSRMFVVGPMVDQSELPFRMLCRQYGSTLAYSPMLHAKSFAEGASYRQHFLTTTPPWEVKAAMEKAYECSRRIAVARATAIDTSSAIQKPTVYDEFSPFAYGFMEEDVMTDVLLVDRPCIVQFCCHEADTVLVAARQAVWGEKVKAKDSDSSSSCGQYEYPVHVEVPVGVHGEEDDGQPHSSHHFHLLYGCDAVDLNLGCPQGIARRGHYGSFLMEDWDLIHTIIHTLHVELEVPVTVKIRVFDHPGVSDGASADTELKNDFDEALTILYARMIRDAGAQVLCIHGRTRDMKGQLTSVANMELIARVRAALDGSIPVISNGNVYTYADAVRHLRETGCEGHMCAEPLLWDPALFSDPVHPVMPGRTYGADKPTRIAALHTALTYMKWVRRCPVDIGFVKAHLFKMCFHSYELHTTFREALGQLKTSVASMKNGEEAVSVQMDVMESGEGITAPLMSAEGGCPAPHATLDTSDKEEMEQEQTGGDSNIQQSSSSPTTGDVFEAYVEVIEVHLRALLEAELKSTVQGAQPKAAQAEKAKAREEAVDVWDDDSGLGITF